MAFNKNFAFKNLDTEVGINQLISQINKLDDAGRTLLLQALNTELSEGKKQAVLAALRAHVATTDTFVRNWLIQAISQSYVAGANYTVKALKAVNFKPVATAPALATINVELLASAPFLKPHLAAVNILLQSSYADFGSTMTGYVKGAEQILNDALKLQTRSTIAMGRLEGTSIADIAKTVKTNIGDKGFTVLLDRGGREWQLGRYSEMVTRTHINKAANEAAINRMGDFEVDIMEVSSHGAQDEACAEEEGQIYSISGDSPNYPPLDGHEPPYHPNCTHNLIPRPDLS